MEIPKEMVIERIRGRGDFEAAQEAERELPEKVDPAADADLLARFGIDGEALSDDLGDQSPTVT